MGSRTHEPFRFWKEEAFTLDPTLQTMTRDQASYPTGNGADSDRITVSDLEFVPALVDRHLRHFPGVPKNNGNTALDGVTLAAECVGLKELADPLYQISCACMVCEYSNAPS
jgi:hypothetical protein